MGFPTQLRDTITAWVERRLTSLTSKTFTKKFTQAQFPMCPRPTQWGINKTYVSCKEQSILLILLWNIRWLLWSTYCGYILVVPFCYTRIFIFRKFYKHPGSDKHQEDNLRQRRRRNVVSFSCNMAIWGVEALATCVVSEETPKCIIIMILSQSHLSRSWPVAALSRITPPAAWWPLPTSPSLVECRPVSTF